MTMLAISAAELASIQADAANAACSLTCTIERYEARADDGQGGGTTTLTPVTTVLAGMSEPSGGQLQNYEYLVGAKAAWQVRFPVGTDVLELDRLSIQGKLLTVDKVLQPRSYQALLTVLASEVNED
jgi:hypothetical protein